ncbi:MAG TPA: bifunctional phosphoribosylaminoimidazolecarboxamide formyltransferase/IMP cyclohydrolase [Anaerolineae bacterium]|nr:bifunctional phosphoribosylaminoimidazolecarboxamide formyltransferase/IMP cyclohydrolase [Anaerolineae bacterium]
MRALLSLSDKTKLELLARGLHQLGYELIASGGTARAITAMGLPVTPVSDITGFPEILGGRVKTLHPAIHGPILARDQQDDWDELARWGYEPIDLVACNLYPFQQTIARPQVTENEALEHIDIGGVTLLRAAAKNYPRVIVLTCPEDYPWVLEKLAGEGLTHEARRQLALKAFRHTAAYDVAIARWLGQQVGGEEALLPEALVLAAERVQFLRYGENPHQRAAFYRWQGQEPAFVQLQGKALSYNNLGDLHGAWGAVSEFETPAVAIIKHANPCGLATDNDLVVAYKKALASDPVSAYGSIIAVNRPVDLPLVEAISTLFVEVLVAPKFTPEALERLARKKNLRVMQATGAAPFPLELHTVIGGLLAQTPDHKLMVELRVVTQRQPTDEERADLMFAWRAVKWVKSNAIVLAKDQATVGIGAGQMSRVDAVSLAGLKAGPRAQGAVLASDAFFPFPDGIERAAALGVTAVIQPGGSIRDEEVITAADRLGLAMVFTGMRHFRH